MSSLESIWERYDADEVRLSAGLSERMLDLAELRGGMRVLDLATGRGEPAVRAAHRVGPSGRVVGIDPLPSMLAMARARAGREGVDLDLVASRAEDLESVTFEAPFDAALARWGLMYMDDPVRALEAVRRHLAPGAPLVIAVWADADRVSYFSLPRRALARFVPLPEDRSNALRYADLEVLRGDLERAGFTLSHAEEMDVEVMEATDDASLLAWVRAFGMNRLLAGLDDEVVCAWERAVCEAAIPLQKGGIVRLGGITRIVVAR